MPSPDPLHVHGDGPPPQLAKNADVIVVGGGPAGLAAALILARANRKVLLFDGGKVRNAASQTQHAILGADGAERAEFIGQARKQVLAYPSVEFHCTPVKDVLIRAAHTAAAKCSETLLKWPEKVTETWDFEVKTEDGRLWHGKKLILATGVRDDIPGVEGFDEFWGKGIWVCLYCDAFEYNGQALGAYGNGERGVHIALEMLLWSPKVTLFTGGQVLEATDKERSLLREKKIRVVEGPIGRAYGGEDGHLAGIQLANGQRVPVKALFFNTGRHQHSTLPTKMGLRTDERGDILCEQRGNVECVHGLYVAGNCATALLKLVQTAASQGAVTGAKVNSELMYEELGLNDNPGPRYARSVDEEGDDPGSNNEADGKAKGDPKGHADGNASDKANGEANAEANGRQ